MPDKVWLDTDRNIINIDSYDDVTEKDILESFKKINDIISEHRVDKVLVDTTRQSSFLDYGDIQVYFSFFPERIKKLAILKQPKQKTSFKLKYLLETTKLPLKIFYNYDDAFNWLMVE